MLLEQMLAAGILAATIATTYGVMSRSTTQIVRSGKRQLAVSVAKAKAEQLATAPHLVEPLQMQTVAGEHNMTLTWEVTQAGLETSSTPNLEDADQLHEIVVTVTYPDANGDDKTLTYRQYRRRRT